MKEGYIKAENRKKILLLTDDIRVHSGVAQIGREMIIHTAHRYNWCQLAGAVQHPDKNKCVKLDDEINKQTGLNDAFCNLYPVDGYGNPDILRHVIKREQPDAIFLITDPRYFEWVFRIENELRQKCPIIYLNIWDDVPAPMYNKEFYESCDLLMGISKQTVNINKMVLGNKAKDKIIEYVPHGLNNKMFFPIEDQNDKNLKGLRDQLWLGKDFEFSLLFNSRNIRRKCIISTIIAWKLFTESLPKEEAEKCLLILHTEAIADPGTDLQACIEYFLNPKISKIRISEQKLPTESMNLLYNSVDGVILLSNAEGWGLALTEAMLTGTPFIATVTGGMQDQMRFIDDKGNWIEFNSDVPSNHRGTYKECGEWALPVFPKVMSSVGSPLTPYIYEDHMDHEDAAERIMELYKMGNKKRKEIGKKGLEWALGDEAGFTSEKMSNRMMKHIDTLFNTWKPRKKYEFLKDTDYEPRVIPHKLIY